MVEESTSDSQLATRPVFGAVAGLAAGGVMLAVGSSLAGAETLNRWLGTVGHLALPASLETPQRLQIAGWLVHLFVAGLLGALHGACQQRTTPGGLLVVGSFYGLVLWIIGGLVLVRLSHLDLPLLQSWSGLPAFLTYGVVLGGWAALDQQRTGRIARSAPVD